MVISTETFRTTQLTTLVRALTKDTFLISMLSSRLGPPLLLLLKEEAHHTRERWRTMRLGYDGMGRSAGVWCIERGMGTSDTDRGATNDALRMCGRKPGAGGEGMIALRAPATRHAPCPASAQEGLALRHRGLAEGPVHQDQPVVIVALPNGPSRSPNTFVTLNQHVRQKNNPRILR